VETKSVRLSHAAMLGVCLCERFNTERGSLGVGRRVRGEELEKIL